MPRQRRAQPQPGRPLGARRRLRLQLHGARQRRVLADARRHPARPRARQRRRALARLLVQRPRPQIQRFGGPVRIGLGQQRQPAQQPPALPRRRRRGQPAIEHRLQQRPASPPRIALSSSASSAAGVARHQRQRLLDHRPRPLARPERVLQQARLLDGQLRLRGHRPGRRHLDVQQVDRRPRAARLHRVQPQRAQHGPERRGRRFVQRQLQVVHRRRQVADAVLEHARRRVTERSGGDPARASASSTIASASASHCAGERVRPRRASSGDGGMTAFGCVTVVASTVAGTGVGVAEDIRKPPDFNPVCDSEGPLPR